MIKRIVFGNETDDPQAPVISQVPYFSDVEIQVAELDGEGRSEKEIAESLNMNQQQANEIKRRIREKVSEILRGSDGMWF